MRYRVASKKAFGCLKCRYGKWWRLGPTHQSAMEQGLTDAVTAGFVGKPLAELQLGFTVPELIRDAQVQALDRLEELFGVLYDAVARKITTRCSGDSAFDCLSAGFGDGRTSSLRKGQ